MSGDADKKLLRKEFMQKLNVEMSRINGWIHSKEEAKEEFGYSENATPKRLSVWQTVIE